MIITIPTKDLGDVKDVFCGDYCRTLEDCNEEYIKEELGL